MKNFLNWIPWKWKGIYLIWFTIHFILILISGNAFEHDTDFIPFNVFWGYRDTVYGYDYSEFLVYTIAPILIVLIIYYLKPPKEIKRNW